MEQVADSLKEEILACRAGHEEDFAEPFLDHAERRSTYVFDQDDMIGVLDVADGDLNSRDTGLFSMVSPFGGSKKKVSLSPPASSQSRKSPLKVRLSPTKDKYLDRIAHLKTGPFGRSCSAAVLPLVRLPFEDDNLVDDLEQSVSSNEPSHEATQEVTNQGANHSTPSSDDIALQRVEMTAKTLSLLERIQELKAKQDEIRSRMAMIQD
jgi:hypothetical protein